MRNTSLFVYKRGPSVDSSKWYMGMLLTFLAESEGTGGRFSLIEGCLKPGNEPPPHVHEREDELFYVLEGKMDVYVGNEVFNVGAGECLFLPRLKPHTFVVRSPRLRNLVLFVPGGLEECFRTRSSPADKLELPTGAVTYSTSNLDSVIHAFEKHGVRFCLQMRLRSKCRCTLAPGTRPLQKLLRSSNFYLEGLFPFYGSPR